MFDNSDGKISGPYAEYAEVSLRRQVSRDGTSNYFLNGARCRRKDITQLFLGTGLGSRSYAIIEQGMISRVIEAKADDMRMFVEEAAGISRYKERRKETEARISDTRENLERLQDVRDEVDKQIRHLQRQAATARRYQAMKETERRLTAELLALRLREIDSGAEVQDSAVRECELRMQEALADQRAAEAAIETQRVYQNEQSERVSAVQGRYYEVGAEISRTEQNITHTRELRDQQRNELAKARATLAELETHIDATSARSPRCAPRSRSSRRISRRRRLPRARSTRRSRAPNTRSPTGSSAGKGSIASRAPRTRPRRWNGRASNSSKTSCAGSRRKPIAWPSSARRWLPRRPRRCCRSSPRRNRSRAAPPTSCLRR